MASVKGFVPDSEKASVSEDPETGLVEASTLKRSSLIRRK